MNCQTALKKLSAHLDGEATEAEALRAHLRGCPACRQALDQLRAAQAPLARFAERRAPPGLADAIAARLRRDADEKAPSRAAGLWIPFASLLSLKNLLGALMSKKPLAAGLLLLAISTGAGLALMLEPGGQGPKPKPAPDPRPLPAPASAERPAQASPILPSKAAEEEAKPAGKSRARARPAIDFKAESRKIKDALAAGAISEAEAKSLWIALKKKAAATYAKKDDPAYRRKMARAREQGYYMEPTQRTVQGRLIDERGEAIADAALVIPTLTGKNPGAEPAEARSDEQGRFALTATRYRFQLRIAPPAGAEGRTVLVPHSETATIDLGDITLRRALRVAGRVLDPDGNPAAGARVRAFSPQAYDAYAAARNVAYIETPATPHEQLSDALGRFELQLSPGPRVIVASGEGLRDAPPQSITVEPASPPLDLRLRPPLRLTVIARDQLGVAVGGAAVKLTRFGQLYQGLPKERVQRNVTAEAGGRAVIADLTEPRYQLIVEAVGFARHRQNLVFEADQGEVEVAVSLQAGARVSGRLVSRDNGEALVRGGLIFAAADPDGRPDMQRLLAKSPIDSDGRFGYEQVPPGRYVLMVHMADHARRDVSVTVPADGADVELGELALTPLGEVQITVLDSEGQAVEALSLIAGSPQSAQLIEEFDPTDSDGRALLRLPRGPVTLTARGKDGGFLVFAELDLRGTNEATVRLPSATAALTGRVLDARGAPLPGQPLLLRRSLQAPLLPVTADEDGRFELAGLPPGSYELLASTASAAQPDFVSASGRVIARLNLSADQTLNRDFSLPDEKE